MSSKAVGASAVVPLQAPLAVYFHCDMHMLNLCASERSRIPVTRNCMDVVSQMTSFFNCSLKRTMDLKNVIRASYSANECADKRTRLVSLCNTRFAGRHDAIITTITLLPHDVSAPDSMSTWSSKETRASAASLLRSLTSFEFIIALHMLGKVSSLLRPLACTIRNDCVLI